MRRLSQLRVRHRVLLIVLLMLVPAAVALVLDSYEDRRIAEERVTSQAQLAARSIESAQARVIESARLVLDLLEQMPQIRSLDGAQCQPILQSLRSNYERYAAMGVFTPQGERVCSGTSEAAPVNVATRSWFQRAIETHTFAIGDYQVGLVSGRPSIGIAKPMLGPYGAVLGVLYVALDLDWLSRHLAVAPLPPDGAFVLMDSTGTVIARYPDPQRWIGKAVGDSALGEYVAGRPSPGFVELPGLDGVSRLYYVFDFGKAWRFKGLYGAVGIPLDEIYQEINLDLVRDLVALLGFGIVLLVAGFLASERLISHPLQQLVAFSQRIAGGDLSARSGLDHGAGELGQLAASLDGMADSLVAQQRALAERNRLLAESQATAHIGSWEWIVDHPRLKCSPELARIFGLEPGANDELPLEDMIARIHPDDRQSCFDSSRRVADGEPRAELEFRLLLPNGEVRHCWSLIERGESEPAGGRPVVRGTTQDITARKRAEQERQRQARFTEIVLQSISDGIIACDAEGRLMTFNGAIERLHGVTFAAVPADGWAGFFGIYERDGKTPVAKEILPLYRALKGEVIVNEELEIRPSGGVPRTVLVNGQPLRDEAGRGIGAVITVRDVTDLRRAEAGLVQAQKMEAVGQLTGGIAHDFNNLLSIVIGNLDVLIARLQSPADQDLAKEALNGALRGAELTRQMLAFARRQALNPVAIEVCQLLRDSAAMLQRTLGGSIVVRTSVEDRLWRCQADPSQLETALLNLAINARDAMPDGGTLTIEARNAHLDSHYAETNPEVAPGDYVKISVSDTGSGIPPELLARVMEPFFTTKEPGKGTGLGLSMVHGFAKQSGGNVKIYSELGHGTTVNLYLPRAAGEERRAAAPEAPDSAAGSASGTVLVVDDDSAVRKTAARQLGELGYRVVEAADGASALDILSDGIAIDLVFSDVVMPGGMTGFDLVKAVRQLHPRMPIVLVTGFAEAALRQRNGLGESVLVLNKPYRRQELAMRIRQALEAAPAEAK